MAKTNDSGEAKQDSKVKRKGTHSKTKTSSNKESKLYKKKNKGQGL